MRRTVTGILAALVVVAVALGFATHGGAGRLPGGGKTATDCYSVFDLQGVPDGTARTVDCTDGDACDTDAACDGTCTFGVALCPNQTDVPGCTPKPPLKNLKGRAKVKGGARIALALPNLAGSVCGAFTAVPVAPRANGNPGRATLTAVAKASGRPKTDKDQVVVRCVRREGPCPTTTTTTTSTGAPATSTTTTSMPGIGLCGNTLVEGAEQCDDGGTVAGDGCNEFCESEAVTCAPASARRVVRVDLDTPQPLAGIRVDLEYPQVHSSIPGIGNSSLVNSRITIFPTGGLRVVNDRDTDLTVVLADVTAFIDSGPLYEVEFDQCTDLALNMCNRNQNVVGCCNDPQDPGQFGDFCQKRECNNVPGAPCTVATEVADCGMAGTCTIARSCDADADCTGGFGTCVFKCPANPPVCPSGTFPIDGTVAPCAPPAPAGGCPGDNVCVTQAASTICTVTDPVDEFGNPVDGVSCTVTITVEPL